MNQSHLLLMILIIKLLLSCWKTCKNNYNKKSTKSKYSSLNLKNHTKPKYNNSNYSFNKSHKKIKNLPKDSIMIKPLKNYGKKIKYTYNK